MKSPKGQFLDPCFGYHLWQHPKGGCPTRGKYHLLHQQYPGGYSGGWHCHARAENKLCLWGHDLLDRASRTEPSYHKDGCGNVYLQLSVQFPLISPKGGGDKALHSHEVVRVVIQWKADKEHAKWTASKVKRIVTSICQLMSNQGALSEGKCKLLAHVTMSVLLCRA